MLTIEFPHLLRLIEEAQFDTIYHEHYSYFSLLTAARVFGGTGCDLRRRGAADARRLAAHLRRARDVPRGRASASLELRERERAAGLEELAT